MNFNKIQTVNFTSKLSDFEVMNSEFIRCKCYALASGDNANGSDITMQAIDKAIMRGEFYNKPIVAHLYKDEEDNGKWRVGGHDSKWVISNNGIEVINECIPFGTIPESSNVRKEEVLEPDGVTKNTYVVMDVILWTGRFNIMDAAYSDDIYFNQSCEISVNEFHYKDNDILSIDDFTFSALCLLNRSSNPDKNVRPCFPSCRVEKIKSFYLDEGKFKENFELMLEKLKQFKTENNSVDNNSIQINKKEETKTMDFSKVSDALAQYKIADTDVAKYGLLTVSDTAIGILDLEDYSVYTVNCTENDGAVVLDMDNKVQCALGVKDFVEGENFDLAGTIESVKTATKSAYETEISKVYQEEYNSKIEEMTQAYADLKAEFDKASEELNKFRQADEARKVAAHKAEIDTVVAQYEKKIGKLAEFLCYRAKLDYTKSVEEVTKELTLMVGRTAMDKNGKSTFSYNPVVAGVSAKSAENKYASEDRYGHLLDKYTNKD